DNALHVYGTPFFIRAALPQANDKRTGSFDRLMIAQDTGSAIVGPARADIYWGAGDEAGRIARGIRNAGSFAMLVPREIDPVVAGARMPLPPEKPPPEVAAGKKTPTTKSARAGSGAARSGCCDRAKSLQPSMHRPRAKARVRWD